MVEGKTGWNNTNIQETMQRLIVLERKMLKTNTVITKYLLRQEGRSFGRNTSMTGEHLIETVSFVLMLVILLSFVAIGVHDLAK